MSENIDGYYYLHTNGELIFKKYIDGDQVADFRESDFVLCFWKFSSKYRLDAWTILVEALSAGARKGRIVELAKYWNCDGADAQNYAKAIDIRLFMDGDSWCATRNDFKNLQESPAGFGVTALEAAAALCTELGYKPQKMWGSSFADLVKQEMPV